LDGDRAQRFGGGAPAIFPVVAPEPIALDLMSQAVLPSTDSYAWFSTTAADRAPNWKNEITARSLELLNEYDPGAWIDRVAPTPLLMIVGANDVVAPFDLALGAYEAARQPKQILVTRGGHFDAYIGAGFDESSAAARDHFLKHL
jgi:hypothetical protein